MKFEQNDKDIRRIFISIIKKNFVFKDHFFISDSQNVCIIIKILKPMLVCSRC